MKVIALLFALAAACHAADVTLGFVRFYKTGATNPTIGYLRLNKAGATFTASGTLTDLTANTMYYAYVHNWGDLSSSDATAHGGCFVASEIFSFTTDGAGAFTFAATAVGGSIDLTGATSIIGRGISIRSSQSCTGAAVAQGVVGIDAPQAGDVNVANIASGAVTAFAKVFVNGNPGNTAYANLAGEVWFTALPAGSGRKALAGTDATVIVYTKITGLTGTHGIHTHYFADSSNLVNLTSAGGHFNPASVTHGYPENPTHHVGDMGNFTVNTAGDGIQDMVLDQMSLGGTNNIVGRMIIVHQLSDNGVDPTTGAAGGRWGYGVIGLSNRKAPNNNLGAASHTVGGSAVAFILAAIMLVRALL